MKIAVLVVLAVSAASYLLKRRRARDLRPGAAGRAVIAANLAASRRR
jgi:hypothetical protein